MLFQLYKSKRVKIGLWIDLTNTNRFYNKNDIETEDCKYFKLQCRGHGETPSREQTDMFINICHNYISNHPLNTIAVHCTHGFNRTGFLIVSYLVERMDCAIQIALEEFRNCRQPGIYKQDYLRELYRRYDDVDDTPDAPTLPDWCNAEENQADLDVTHGKGPVFMFGISGVSSIMGQPKAAELQRKVQQMCEWKGKKGFPGCQPVTMDINNISLLNQKSYRVSWKADGTRYMMLIDGENGVYFFDRDNNVFQVKQLRFPHRKDYSRHLVNTLLDGEMVIDKVNEESIPRYLAYDIIKFEGQDVGKLPFFPVRFSCIQNEIIVPRHSAILKGFINKTTEPFSIRAKEFWPITQTYSLLSDKFSKTLSHEPDGLIFQPSNEPYSSGRCDHVLKWKPEHLNSVDFRLKIVRESGEGLLPRQIGHLYVGQLDRPFAQMRYTKQLKDLNNKIIECKFVKNQWIFMRERTDKSFPNSYTTSTAVCNSIRKPVTKEKLLHFIEFERFHSDTESAPKRIKR